MNDKLIMENYLLILKSTVEVYVHGTLESSNNDIKKHLKTGLDDTMTHQKDTYDLMTEYGLTWEDNFENNDFDEDKIFEFARELLQKAQNVIDTADTVAYEKEFVAAGVENTAFTYTKYLTYEENEDEQNY